MVIHDHQGDWFWVAYSIAGVALPLIGLTAARRCRTWLNSIFEARAAKELAEE